MQEANMAAAKYTKLMGAYSRARGLSEYEQDMIRDEYKGRTFAKAEMDLPRDAFYKPA